MIAEVMARWHRIPLTRKGLIAGLLLGFGSLAILDSLQSLNLHRLLTAELEERSARRYRELVRKGEKPKVAEVRSEMSIRDRRDESRAESPLTRAPDAIVLDTTGLDPDEVLQRMIEHVAEKLPNICA